MTEQRRARCIDCGTPCSWIAYRCRPCADKERGAFMIATGKGLAAHRSREAQRQAFEDARTERIAVIEEDLELGIDPERIAAQFGVKRDSLGRSLDRAGRHDLAARFYVNSRPRNRYSQGRTCADCGQRCTNGCDRCRTCANSQRAHERWSKSPWRAA